MIKIKGRKSGHINKKKKKEFILLKLMKIYLITLSINKYQRTRKMLK